jgi:hypothetical protein
MKSLLDVQDGDSAYGDWEIPGTEITLSIEVGSDRGRFVLKRGGWEDMRLTAQVLTEFSGQPKTADVAHEIARRIQEIEGAK